MKIVKRTPRTDIQEDAILRNAYLPRKGKGDRKKGDKEDGLIDAIAAELTVDEDMAFIALSNFIALSTRVVWEDGEIDFEPLTPMDDAATIREKFFDYLESSRQELLRAVLSELRDLDSPADEAAAPEPPDPDEADAGN